MRQAPIVCLATGMCFACAEGARQAPASQPEQTIEKALTFYASFDHSTTAEVGQGDRQVWTRYDHATEKGKTIASPGCDAARVKLDAASGAHGGSLRFTDVIPRNGFLFYKAGPNLAFDEQGWGGSASLWIKVNPASLKTPHCDPIMIVEKRYFDGAVWCDFDEDKPRDLRLGLFRSLRHGEQPPAIPGPNAPLAIAKDPHFDPRAWHHLCLVWANLNSGRSDARATLFLDGVPIARLSNQKVDMRWNLAHVRLFLGAALIG